MGVTQMTATIPPGPAESALIEQVGIVGGGQVSLDSLWRTAGCPVGREPQMRGSSGRGPCWRGMPATSKASLGRGEIPDRPAIGLGMGGGEE